MTRSKYNVSSDLNSRTYDGIVFDSELEMKFFRDYVCVKYKSGEIVAYELQKEYIIQPQFKYNGKNVRKISYVADFYLKYKDGHEEVIDTKGMPDSVSSLKRKLMWYHFPSVYFKWISYSKKYGGWIEYDELKKLRKMNKKEKINGKD